MEQILRVLIIEDNENDVAMIVRELKRANGFTIVHKMVSQEQEIRHALTHSTWDIIICDYFLTNFDAPRVLVLLEDLGVDIPFILVSGSPDAELVKASLRIRGVHEYVDKNHLSRLGPVFHRELRLYSGYDEMINAWARALEMRDHETLGHSERVVSLTLTLARKMGIAESEMVHIRRGALLHDIGKMAIPDAILLKPGTLSEVERAVMKAHAIMGYEMLKNISVLRRSLDIPHYHHERWDGNGYPAALEGWNIPLSARIFAVVDVWDALTNDRPYRKAMDKESALKILSDQSGKAFDPKVVSAFLEMLKEEA